MTDTEQAKVLSRVRKLMNLANNAGATEGERDNALRMAHATLAKYNLDIAQVEVDKGTSPLDEKRTRESEEFLGKPWAISIAAAIARLYFCHYYYTPIKGAGGPNQKARHSFIGRTSNVITAREMAQFVVGAVNKEAQRYQRQTYGTYADYRAFAQGAMQRIRERCAEILEASQQQKSEVKATGTALVLANVYAIELAANQKYMTEVLGVRLGSGRAQTFAAGDQARAAGRQFGSSVSLQGQVNSGSRGRIGRG